MGWNGQTAHFMNMSDDAVDGQIRGADQQLITDAFDFPDFVDNGLNAEAILIVSTEKMFIDQGLHLFESIERREKTEQVYFLACGDLHTGNDLQTFPGGVHHIPDIGRCVVVAHGDQVEFCLQRLFDDRFRVHIQLRAGRQAGMNVQIAVKKSQHASTGCLTVGKDRKKTGVVNGAKAD